MLRRKNIAPNQSNKNERDWIHILSLLLLLLLLFSMGFVFFPLLEEETKLNPFIFLGCADIIGPHSGYHYWMSNTQELGPN